MYSSFCGYFNTLQPKYRCAARLMMFDSGDLFVFLILTIFCNIFTRSLFIMFFMLVVMCHPHFLCSGFAPALLRLCSGFAPALLRLCSGFAPALLR
ncbi:MAG: hypothetical protein LBJ38_00510, partial [Oscillospiraceae bacterium]|nr:hypothetical protein [Oscillospiraceae bacterium]